MVGLENKGKISNSTRTSLCLKGGAHLGKYRLSRCLGIGGDCEVGEARDGVEGRWVALKTPLAGVGGERDSKKVLLREIRAVSSLRHPNILAVKNADIIADYAVPATEMSMGTLADCSKPVSVKRTVSVIAQVGATDAVVSEIAEKKKKSATTPQDGEY